MKILYGIVLLFAMSCGGRQRDLRAADDPLEAGREYIDACLKGDFSRAAYFMLPGDENAARLKEKERDYREKDKEGRQQYRTASININEVIEISRDTTVIKYSNTVDKQRETIQVIRHSGAWLVNPVNADSSKFK
jgi:hypothetical protein